MTRRLSLHRELSPTLRFPGMEWPDAQTELLGASPSVLFPGLAMGGMTVDTAIFVQSALGDMTHVETAAKGQWRINSKLGSGWSTSRHRGEIVSNAYACLPTYDEEKGAFVGGVEFTLSVRGSVPNDSSLKAVEQVVATTVNEVVGAIMAKVVK